MIRIITFLVLVGLSFPTLSHDQAAYIVGSVGGQRIDDVDDFSFDNAAGFTIGTGYAWPRFSIDLNYYYALEADFYVDNIIEGEVEISIVYLMGRFHIPVGDKVEFTIGAGFGRGEFDIDIDGFGSESESENSELYEIGLNYYFQTNMGLIVNWRKFPFLETDIDVISVGIEYKF